MNATPNSFQNFNSLSLNYLKFITPKIWVLHHHTQSAAMLQPRRDQLNAELRRVHLCAFAAACVG
jgi:hypothetical protein